MHCKSCAYPLWNLTARTCPECGAPFKPSDFEFTLNSVRFCCPHCAQDYYGTGAKGHLVPSYFSCVSCGKAVHMDECVLLPTQGVHEDLTKADENPWLERARLGRVKAWFQTLGRSMTQPTRLIESTPPGSPWGIWFALITNLIYMGVGWAGLLIFIIVMSVVASGKGATGPMLGATGGIGAFVVALAVLYLLGVFVWIYTTHAILRFTGATAHPIARTAQAICYASGANALSAIPCLSMYVAPIAFIWWAVSACIMVAKGQRVSGGRATLAVLTLPGLLLLASVATIGFFMYAAVSGSPNLTFPAPPTAGSGQASTPLRTSDQDHALIATTHVSDALQAHRADSGHWPFHAIELVGGGLRPQQLSLHASAANPDAIAPDTSIRLYNVSVDQFFAFTSDARRTFLDFVRNNTPPTVIAHRLGDFVFTFHGVDPDANPDLWVVVFVPPASAPAGTPCIAANADGSLAQFQTRAEFDAALAAQNTLRQEAGLAPLPNPDTILADAPARSDAP